MIEFKDKYFIAEISSVNKIAKNPNDQSVVNAITAQIKFKSIVDNNMSIGRKISEEILKKDFEEYAKKIIQQLNTKRLKV